MHHAVHLLTKGMHCIDGLHGLNHHRLVIQEQPYRRQRLGNDCHEQNENSISTAVDIQHAHP